MKSETRELVLVIITGFGFGLILTALVCAWIFRERGRAGGRGSGRYEL